MENILKTDINEPSKNEESNKENLQIEIGNCKDKKNYNTNSKESNKLELSNNDEELQFTNLNKILTTDGTIINNNEEKISAITSDPIDKRLSTFLNDFNSKRKVSAIPFKRVSQGKYEFGSQQVLLKIENDNIKGLIIILIIVRVGGGNMLLEKFIELNTPFEQLKILSAKYNCIKSKIPVLKKLNETKLINKIENSDNKNFRDSI